MTQPPVPGPVPGPRPGAVPHHAASGIPGIPRVSEPLDALDALDSLPVGEHPAIFESVLQELTAELEEDA